MGIKIIPAFGFPVETAALFAEYTEMLIAGDPAFQEYLAIQDYGSELEHLEEKYGPPGGRLYLAYCDGEAAGCVGLRRIDAGTCEMKRLYVRPGFRGKRLGDSLVRQVIQDAKDIGYSRMLLDTLPFLQHALALYRRHGFYEIPRYNNSPMDTSIYMQLEL